MILGKNRKYNAQRYHIVLSGKKKNSPQVISSGDF